MKIRIKGLVLCSASLLFLLLPLILNSNPISHVYAAQATLSLSPASGTVNRSCAFALEVNLDTGGGQTDGTDAILLYDTSVFSATSINKGTIYQEYPGTAIDDSAGRVTISGLASVTQSFSGQGKLATVNLLVKDTAPTGTSQIKFDFDPSNPQKTTDSNVVEHTSVAEILSSVTNGNYTVGTGTCTGTDLNGSGVGGSKGGTGVETTPSGQLKTLPADQFKTLPPAGNEKLTFTLAILGSTLTILGILGLVLL
ncbi:MAG: hypothetical protein HYW45_03520 [Candidatus Daviesbacteria bacterium]|nr:MAG: hypothetical protein HYW45_03520 [Candidatus Daviesbacteria bacterium]